MALCLTFWVGLSSSSMAGDPGFVLIVHPGNPASTLERGFVRDAYLKQIISWPGGPVIRPVDLSGSFPARVKFAAEVLHKAPSQLRTYWSQRVFSGTGLPPPELESPAQVLSYVLENRGAIGYLPAGFAPGGAKVISLR